MRIRYSRALVEQLKRSNIYRDYCSAFHETTGLSFNLRPIDSFDLLHPHSTENHPGATVTETDPCCASCGDLQREVVARARLDPKALKCFAGLCDSAVPVLVGEDTVAILQTGQILLRQPSRREFSKVSRKMMASGAEVDLRLLKQTYFETKVLEKARYAAMLRLLVTFAQHLSMLSNSLLAVDEQKDPPMVARAKNFIDQHLNEEISLRQVAAAVNSSTFYLCKMFKQATGMTFTGYLARIRIEKVKGLLLNPHKRISEAAYETGFQSLSQFNRVFRRVAGEPPSAWRDKLPAIRVDFIQQDAWRRRATG